MRENELCDVWITVLERLTIPTDIFTAYASPGQKPECPRNRGGSVYLSRNGQKPEGLCSDAWSGMQERVRHLAAGGNYPRIGKLGTELFTCLDGLHPVLYLLERQAS